MTIQLKDVAVLSAAAVILLFFRIFRRGSSAPLPPGPKKLFLLENLLDMPREYEWLKYAERGSKYGNLVSASIFGQQYIIVNSAKTALEMLEKKSRIYSDRPVVQMGGELVGWKEMLTFLPYNQRFRDSRKMFHQIIGTSEAMSKFHHIEEMAVHRFLKRLYSKPEELVTHIRETAGTIILHIAYGYRVKEGNDPFISIADKAVTQFSLASSPGVFLVNMIPSLKYLPDWFPGSGFKQTARAWRKTLHDMVENPYQFVKKQMELGMAEPSMLSNLLQNESELSDDQIFNIKWTTATAYSAGADTTVATVHAFFKAMLLYPEVQKQAQAEIDAVIGNDRLPTMEDREKLPFVNIVAVETLRWHTVAPTGFAHCVTEDDIHDGYLIPKGAVIIPNIWKMAHDSNVYHRPLEFNPSRFIETKDYAPEPDPREFTFGFGRRICPGRLLVDTSVFLSCVMTLAVFNITPYMENGKAVIPDLDQCTGINSHPSKFKCQITPRSAKALALINAEL